MIVYVTLISVCTNQVQIMNDNTELYSTVTVYYGTLIPLPPPRAEPGGNVSNVSVSLVVDSGEHEANISWTPLSPGDWNGIPYRYYVSSTASVACVVCD